VSPDATHPVLCLGSGAIGSLVGGWLCRAGVPVALVGRGEHFETIRSRGLVIEEGSGSDQTHVSPPAFSSVESAVTDLGPPRTVILTVKGFDVPTAADELARSLRPGPAAEDSGRVPRPLILCLQNGLGAEEAVAARFGPASVLGGAITLSVTRPRPGRIRMLTDHGGIALAPLERHQQTGASSGAGPDRSPAEEVASVLAGFRVAIHDLAARVKWSKLLLNLWANAGAAVFGVLPEDIVRDPALFHVEWAAFREALRVMRRAGVHPVDLPGYPVRLLVAVGRLLPEEVFRRAVGPKVVGGRGGKVPSLLGDVRSGRSRTEAPFLNGAVAEAARRLGLEAPVNRALAEAVEALASGNASPERYAAGPETLF